MLYKYVIIKDDFQSETLPRNKTSITAFVDPVQQESPMLLNLN